MCLEGNLKKKETTELNVKEIYEYFWGNFIFKCFMFCISVKPMRWMWPLTLAREPNVTWPQKC